MVSKYGEALRARTADIGAREAGYLRLSFVGLQQRLLSSIAAFAKTLAVHRNGLVNAQAKAAPAVAEAFVQGAAAPEDEPDDSDVGETLIAAEEDEAAEAAGALAASVANLALVDEMLALARNTPNNQTRAFGSLVRWIRENLTSGSRWNERRLVLFTEYEDTRRWLEIQLAEALDDLAPDDRIAPFTGATSTERREELKRKFNTDPAKEPLRILICTDAAREGINLADALLTTSFTLICPGTRRGLNSATAASTANCSRPRKSGVAISSMSSAPRTWSCKRSFARPSAFASNLARQARSSHSGWPIVSNEKASGGRRRRRTKSMRRPTSGFKRPLSPRWMTRRRRGAPVRPRNWTNSASCVRNRASVSASIRTMLKSVVAEGDGSRRRLARSRPGSARSTASSFSDWTPTIPRSLAAAGRRRSTT